MAKLLIAASMGMQGNALKTNHRQGTRIHALMLCNNRMHRSHSPRLHHCVRIVAYLFVLTQAQDRPSQHTGQALSFRQSETTSPHYRIALLILQRGQGHINGGLTLREHLTVVHTISYTIVNKFAAWPRPY